MMQRIVVFRDEEQWTWKLTEHHPVQPQEMIAGKWFDSSELALADAKIFATNEGVLIYDVEVYT